jgi:hypothetical protein
MTFLVHIETIISKSARMVGFIIRLSKEFRDPYTLKTLYASLVWLNLEYASSIWSPHQACHSERIERIQHNPLPAYDSRCALLGLESVADRRRVSSAYLLCGRVDSPLLTSKLRFEQHPYAGRCHAKLLPFFHRTNYG